MENLYALDETLDFLNGTGNANISAYIENVITENNTFLNMIDEANVLDSFKETCKRIIEKIKAFIATVTAKIKSMAIDKLCNTILENIKKQKEQLKDIDHSKKLKVSTSTIVPLLNEVMTKMPSAEDILKNEYDLSVDGISDQSIKDILKEYTNGNPLMIKFSFAIVNKLKDVPEIAQVSVSDYDATLDNIEKIVKDIPETFKKCIDAYNKIVKEVDEQYKAAEKAEDKASANAKLKEATKAFNLYANLAKGLFKAVNGAMVATSKDIKSLVVE